MERSLISSLRPLFKTLNGRCVHSTRPRNLTATAGAACRMPSQRPTHPSPRHCIHVIAPQAYVSRPPKSRDRGPRSNEDTQTDFNALDVLRNTAAPASAIDACTENGFALNNQVRLSGSGVLLVGGEVYRWRPWVREDRREGTVGDGATGKDAMTGRLLNAKGQWEVPEGVWGLLELVWPKPGKIAALSGRETGLTVACRPLDHRYRTSGHAHCARRAKVSKRPRYPARDSGYEKRCRTIQSPGDGAGREPSRRRADTHRLERRTVR